MRRTPLLLLIVVALTGAGARALDSPPVVEFADTPYRIASLGMSMWLPAGTKIDSSNILGSDINFQISSPDNSWMMRGFSPESRDRELTALAVMESLLESLLKPEQVARELKKEWNVTVSGANGRLLDRADELLLDGKPAARFYASMDRPDGLEVVTGYTVQWLGPGRFMLYEFTSFEQDYEPARGVFEAILAATTFVDPGESAQLRATGVKNANALLGALTKADLDAMMSGSEGYTFYRLYRPAPSGSDMDATEVAYQRIRMGEGQRGEVDPTKPRRAWGVKEREHGYIVQVDGRYLNGESVIESQGVFFLSHDRSQELWAIRTQIRDSINRIQNWDEMGVREDDDIKVTVSQPGAPAELTQWKVPPEAYCPQVMSFLLPKLYVSMDAPQVFNVYRYNSSATDLSLRSDSLERSASGSRWMLRTRLHENAQEELTALDERGEIVRRVMASGVVMEPIELETLFDLWERKGLPLD